MATDADASAPERGLLDRHFDLLHVGSGIDPGVVAERGYFSALAPADLLALGFSRAQARQVPALVLPVCARTQ